MNLLYSHLSIYFLVFIVSRYLFTSYIFQGWSIFGFVSVGHELYHLLERNHLQSLVAFLCLDLWVTPGSVWIRNHNEGHHKDVWGQKDREHLTDYGIVGDFIATVITLAEAYEIFNLSLINLVLWIWRLWFFGWSIVPIYGVVMFCVMYFTFITHGAPMINHSDNYIMKQIHRSIDIFPDSWLLTLIMGGFNIHVAHHIAPSRTRDDLYSSYQRYKEIYKPDYLWVSDLKQLWRLYLNRTVRFKTPEERRSSLGISN